MSGIVCAIRGGAASQPTIEQAIVAAKKTALPLYFLYLVNVNFLMRTAQTRVQVITQQLEEMGEFILLAAQSQAQQQGVTAHDVIRHGDVSEQIIAVCQELTADYVVLGRPLKARAENVFTHDQLQTFGKHIAEETGAKIIFEAGDIT